MGLERFCSMKSELETLSALLGADLGWPDQQRDQILRRRLITWCWLLAR